MNPNPSEIERNEAQKSMLKSSFSGLALALCVLLTIAFVVGCSGGEQPTEQSPATDSGRQPTEQPTPTAAGQPTKAFASIGSGGRHTCGLREDGAAVCWGADGEGQASPPGR